MAINFSIGEYVVINRAYVEKILDNGQCGCTAQALSTLGYIGSNPSIVNATGSVFVNSTVKSFIKVTPASNLNPAYNGGNGVTIYFCSDAHLNNSLELSTAFIDDKCFVKAQNISGSAITKGQFVYQAGFDGTLQLPNIDLASAAAASTCAALGLAAADIGAGECGSILIEGSFVGFDTSGFTNVGQTVFLSDTPGAISVTAGTTEKVIAKVASISATDGTLIMDTITAGNGGGGGGGFFTDGTGTNAGIGKGATAPIAGGTNSLAQGDTATADGDNSFALGDTSAADGASSFAQGVNNTASGDQSFAQGYNNTVTSDNSMAQGYSNDVTGIISFAQGYFNTVNGDQGATQGANNYLSGDYTLSQGVSNNNDANYTFTQGFGQNVDSQSSFAQGYNNTISSPYSFAQGYNNGVGTQESFVQGRSNTIASTSGRCNVALGYSNYIGGSSAYQNVAIGYNNSVEGDNNFVQGYSSNSYGEQVMVQGSENSWDGNNLQNIFAQGNTVTFDGSQSAYQVFAQGRDLTIGGEATNSFVQGYNMDVGGNDDSFAQGRGHSWGAFSRERTFVQGAYALVENDDQKVWGSNRTSPVGGAQSSHIVRYTSTASATPISMLTISTTIGKAYSISANIVAKNDATADEAASFVLSQALVYNDAGVTLVGAPTFTATDSGGGSASWAAAISTAGSAFTIVITGDATDLVQWCCDLHYVEISAVV